ncbi:FAD-dependent monooxygenase [Dyella sp. C9]|uniref:FAD-dependent monooxygenase n=1 Tax=Dyella sp. C9 TaxID=2202154 RepID=UPI000DEFD311|nr:FAD-dependent monooxygenase [Dyella sp. C9]
MSHASIHHPIPSTARTVLISGGGVAGLALAYWLDRAGFNCTVVERSPELRSGGQAVDIRGVALDVIHTMGLYEEVCAMRTRLRGMSTLDIHGQEVERTEERTFSAGRLDSDDIEIFRDDLCRLLQDKAGERVSSLYGDSVQSITQDEHGVSVAFQGGEQRRFDLVIGADGIYSNVRGLCFGDEASFLRPLECVMALFSVPNLIDLSDWQLMYRDRDMGYVIYPSRDQHELRVCVGFGVEGSPVSRRDVRAQKARVAERCAALGGAFPRFLAAMHESPQFYYGELAQVRMPRWSDRRVVLLGDAAHCASPFSGQGTSLALVGSFVLGRELARTPDDPARAFAAYEARMRPYVDLNQGLVDLSREGHVPDELMTRAKHGIDLGDLLQAA